MNLTLNEQTLSNEGLTVAQALMLLVIKQGININELLQGMLEKEMIVPESLIEGDYLITYRWSDALDKALLDADKEIPNTDDITLLADEMRNLFPAGRKATTDNNKNYYWRGNTRDVVIKLQKFFKLYGNKYTREQILAATKKYVDNFNGQYDSINCEMRLCKYFIFKYDRKTGEEVSDLATILDNMNEETDMLSPDWTSNMA